MWKEKNTNTSKIEEAFSLLIDNELDDEFIRSLKRQYDMKGFLSEKQEKALMKNYLKKKHWVS